MSKRRVPSDPTHDLMQALTRDATRAGCVVTLIDTVETPWSSATFTGTLLHIMIAVTDCGSDAWLDALPERDLPVRRHLVADLAVASRSGTTATLHVLLLESA